MIEIMLWKFFWTYQKNHAIENHTMENHVRQGLTVIGITQNIYPDFVLQAYCETKKMILLPNVFKFLVLDIRIDRSIRMTATTKYPLNSRCPSCWRHTSVFFCGLITSNLAGIYTQSALKIEKKLQKDLNNNSPILGFRLHSKSKAISKARRQLLNRFQCSSDVRQSHFNLLYFFIKNHLEKKLKKE